MAGIGSLPLFHQIAGKPVLVLGEGTAADARRRLVERAGGNIVDSLEAGVRIAFIAMDDADAARATADELQAAGLLVNVTDRPELCDFTVPSILDRDPVLVAVGTGGASAGLAKQLRLRLERILPQSLGELARALFRSREALHQRLPSPADRRRALDEALREGGVLDPLNEHAVVQVANWAGEGEVPRYDRTETITLSSADPDDLTLRQARLLGEADTLICEGKIPEPILVRARADAVRVDADHSESNPGLTVRLIAPDQAA